MSRVTTASRQSAMARWAARGADSECWSMLTKSTVAKARLAPSRFRGQLHSGGAQHLRLELPRHLPGAVDEADRALEREAARTGSEVDGQIDPCGSRREEAQPTDDALGPAQGR